MHDRFLGLVETGQPDRQHDVQGTCKVRRLVDSGFENQIGEITAVYVCISIRDTACFSSADFIVRERRGQNRDLLGAESAQVFAA